MTSSSLQACDFIFPVVEGAQRSWRSNLPVIAQPVCCSVFVSLSFSTRLSLSLSLSLPLSLSLSLSLSPSVPLFPCDNPKSRASEPESRRPPTANPPEGFRKREFKDPHPCSLRYFRCICAHISVYVFVCMSVRMHVCMYVGMYIRV